MGIYRHQPAEMGNGLLLFRINQKTDRSACELHSGPVLYYIIIYTGELCLFPLLFLFFSPSPNLLKNLFRGEGYLGYGKLAIFREDIPGFLQRIKVDAVKTVTVAVVILHVDGILQC